MRRDDPNWPAPSSPAVSAAMRANSGPTTSPETAVRSLLHRRGLRFRKRLIIRLGDRRWTRPDLVFVRPRIAVFIDGCFWHRCPEHGVTPRTNASYWVPKLTTNVLRDRDTDSRLAALGWDVMRVWEHEDPLAVADRIDAAVRKRTSSA